MVDNSLDIGRMQAETSAHEVSQAQPSGRRDPGEQGRFRMKDDEMMKRIRMAYEADDMDAFMKMQMEMTSPDFVEEYPQSGERFRGRDKIAEMNSSYTAQTGSTPKAKLRRILKPGDAWVIEGTIDYGDGVPVNSISILEMGPDGKIARQTDYFANPFEAPAWRAKYAEQMQPVGAR